MNFKTEITKLHYNKNPHGALFNLLRVCSLFYGAGSSLKNFLYDKKLIKPKRAEAYVISAGNFTTGGVGKTPVVAEIAKYLVNERVNDGVNDGVNNGVNNGVKVAIISRGYGGKLNNKEVNVISDGINLYYKADMAGDEPYWLAVNLNMCAVLTCSSRYKAAKYAVEKMGITHIILDDGFQHRKLYRDLNIVLIDSEKQFGNGLQLPAGPLREQVNFNRVDKVVVVSKNSNHTEAEKFVKEFGKKGILCKIEPDYIYNIVTGEHLSEGAEITALSAIGQPEQFYKFLENNYNIKNKITFDDHHQYTIDDIESIEGNIVTTEKDAVKLAMFGKTNIYALKLKTTLDTASLLKE